MSTIREVAAHAGVSIATVSRVMNNDTTYKMTGETRDRVWKAIVEISITSYDYTNKLNELQSACLQTAFRSGRRNTFRPQGRLCDEAQGRKIFRPVLSLSPDGDGKLSGFPPRKGSLCQHLE